MITNLQEILDKYRKIAINLIGHDRGWYMFTYTNVANTVNKMSGGKMAASTIERAAKDKRGISIENAYMITAAINKLLKELSIKPLEIQQVFPPKLIDLKTWDYKTGKYARTRSEK